MLEAGEGPCIALQIEAHDEGIGAERHPLTQLGQFVQQRAAATPGQQGGKQADDFPVAWVIESVRKRDRVGGNEGVGFVPAN